MAPLDVLQIFKDAGALKTGHFILSSGRHSAVFLQKALVFSDPVLSAQLSAALAEKLQARHAHIDLVCSPAVGGIIPGYETARALGCRAFYTEREAGQMCLRRGFEVAPGTKLVIVEDIVTTGLSMREACAALKRHCPEAEIIGTACMIDRSGGKADTGPAPLTTLAQLDFEDYAPDQIPASLAAIKPVKPGSRNL